MRVRLIWCPPRRICLTPTSASPSCRPEREVARGGQPRVHRLHAAPFTAAFGVTRTIAENTPIDLGSTPVSHRLAGQPVRGEQVCAIDGSTTRSFRRPSGCWPARRATVTTYARCTGALWWTGHLGRPAPRPGWPHCARRASRPVRTTPLARSPSGRWPRSPADPMATNVHSFHIVSCSLRGRS
jgi:hypothetical protein